MRGRTIAFLTLLIVLWFMAPLYHRWIGHSDEAAWIQLWMMPSGLVGIGLCLINLKAGSKQVQIAISIVCFIHLSIGLGLHPR